MEARFANEVPKQVQRRANARRRARAFTRYVAALDAHFQGLVTESTLKQYRSKLKQLHEFCVSHGHHFPVKSPSVLLLYLESKAQLRPSSITNCLQCLASVYEVLGWEFPKSREIDHWIRRHRRSKGIYQRQALAVEGALLRRLLQYQPTNFMHQQTQLMIRIGFDTLLRASNLGSIRTEDIAFDDMGTGRLFVPNSKSDQEGRGRFVPLSFSTCQVLKAWISKYGLTHSYLFSRSESRLDERKVDNRFITQSLRDLAFATDLPREVIDGLSSHSFRVGGAVDALQSGMTMEQLMIAGNWSSVRTVENYVRNADPAQIMAKRSQFSVGAVPAK